MKGTTDAVYDLKNHKLQRNAVADAIWQLYGRDDAIIEDLEEFEV